MSKYPVISAREWCLQTILAQAAFGLYGGFFDYTDGPARVGDLVYLQSAPPNLEYISWLVEIGEEARGWPRYVLKGVGQDVTCSWGNVGLIPINRKWVADTPQLRWSDADWDWYRKWQKVVARVDPYLYLPMLPDITGEHAVVGFRTRHSFDNVRTSQILPDWRKATLKQMTEFLKAGITEHEAASNEHAQRQKREKEAQDNAIANAVSQNEPRP